MFASKNERLQSKSEVLNVDKDFQVKMSPQTSQSFQKKNLHRMWVSQSNY